MSEKEIQEVIEKAQSQGIEIVKLEWVGLDLILRNMSTSIEHLEDAIIHGIGVTKAQQSFNVLDHIVPDGLYGSESSEFKLVPDISTFTALPHLPGIGRMQTELCEPQDLKPTATDTRYFLRRMTKKLGDLGFSAKCGLEPEFYLLSKDRSQLVSGKLMSSIETDMLSEFLLEARKVLKQVGIEVEHVKKEYGGSQFEITYRYDEPLKTADNFVLLRNVIKTLAIKRGFIASFMPKVSTSLPGSGLHLHLSLFDAGNSKNAIHSDSDPRGLGISRTAYNFIGGLMTHMKALCAFENPLSNSYKRFIPGSWAPAHVSYGYDHRGVAIRIPSVPPGSTESKRIELRLPDCAANPHLALGAVLAAGIDGIERGLDPGQALDYDPAKYNEAQLKERNVEMLPTSLIEAIHFAEEDKRLRGIMGETLFDEYIKVRKSEWNSYYRNVDEWEVNNFLESI